MDQGLIALITTALTALVGFIALRGKADSAIMDRQEKHTNEALVNLKEYIDRQEKQIEALLARELELMRRVTSLESEVAKCHHDKVELYAEIDRLRNPQTT